MTGNKQNQGDDSQEQAKKKPQSRENKKEKALDVAGDQRADYLKKEMPKLKKEDSKKKLEGMKGALDEEKPKKKRRRRRRKKKVEAGDETVETGSKKPVKKPPVDEPVEVPVNPFAGGFKPVSAKVEDLNPFAKSEVKSEDKSELDHEVEPELELESELFEDEPLEPELELDPEPTELDPIVEDSSPEPINPFAASEPAPMAEELISESDPEPFEDEPLEPELELDPEPTELDPIMEDSSPEPINPFAASEPAPMAAAPNPEPINPFAASEPAPMAAAPTPEPINPFAASEPAPMAAAPNPEPINPFAAPSKKSLTNNSAKKNDEEEEEDLIKDVAPINPFEKAPEEAKVDSMPMAEEVVTETEEESTPEDLGHAVEHGAVNSEDNNGDLPIDSNTEAEVVDAIPIDNPPPDAEVFVVDDEKVAKDKKAEVEEFKESVWDILEQAGLTRGRIMAIGLGFVVVVILFLFLSLGWYKPIFGIFGGNEPVISDTDEDSSDTSSLDLVNVGRPVGVISSYIFGLENTPIRAIQAVPITTGGSRAGFQAGFAFGQPFNFNQQKFVKDLALLRKMQNIFETDIYALLDLASDRRASLEQFIADYDGVIQEAEFALSTVEVDIALLQTRFDAAAAEVETQELAFFDNLDALMGQRAYNNLQLFINASKETSGIKADFNAKTTVRDMLLNSLYYLEPRREDIVSNKEALVKGVRVFDIAGSDIEAIIRLDQAEGN
jgi:hypothetical protein